MKNANLLLQLGNNMYYKAKKFIFCAPLGFLLLLITAFFCGEYAAAYLLLGGHYFGVNLLVLVWYAIIAVGLCAVWPYFMGLILIGIGQIAKNTSTEAPSETEVTYSKIRNAAASVKKTVESKPVMTPSALSKDKVEEAKQRGNWICSCCGKENTKGFTYCEKCGMSK